MTDHLVLFMYESWSALDNQTKGLSLEQITTRYDGGSSIAWTLGHVTNMLDSWINVRYQGLPPNPVVSDRNFRTGGNGDAKAWRAVETAVREVRQAARRFLDTVPSPDLERVIPYDGSITYLRSTGLRLRYAVMRITAHHYMHAGEVASTRVRLGYSEGGPGQMWGRAPA